MGQKRRRRKTPCFASFSYWGVHWLKLAPELKKVPGGKMTTHNILFGPIITNIEEIFEIGADDFGGVPRSQYVRHSRWERMIWCPCDLNLSIALWARLEISSTQFIPSDMIALDKFLGLIILDQRTSYNHHPPITFSLWHCLTQRPW